MVATSKRYPESKAIRVKAIDEDMELRRRRTHSMSSSTSTSGLQVTRQSLFKTLRFQLTQARGI